MPVGLGQASLVVMKDRGDIVVLPTNDTGVQHVGLGVKWVDGGVNTQLSNGAGQYSVGVQVGGGRRGSVKSSVGT